MKIRNKLIIFGLILFVSLTAVSAADIIEDDSSAVAVETPQIDQTNEESFVQESVQTDNNLDEEDNPSPCSQTPRIIDSDLVINNSNYNCYNNVNWTVSEGATVDGSNLPFNNVAINVIGNYVTLKNLKISTNNATKLIDATGTKNLTIQNSTLTLTNFGTTSNNETIGIDLTNTANATITGTTLNVNAPSQKQEWVEDDDGNWYSTLKVSAILVNNAKNITIDQNTIHITNTTEKYAYTTMPAITIKNGASNINVTFNTLTSTGAQFVYGIMMNDGVSNVAIKNNTVGVQDVLYVAGIDASTATDSVVSGNHITATSTGQTTYDPIVGEESLAYGIISDTYTTGNENNRICNNTIVATANTVYGIEVYKGDNITVCSNNIFGNGNKTMGVAFAHTNNSKIINNFMRLTGTTVAHHSFYEEVTPVNAGIIFTNQSNGNWIQGNDIEITTDSDSNTYAINLQNSTTATITGNRLYAEGSDILEENYAIEQDNLCSEIVIETNEGVVLYNCDCGCLNILSSENEAIFFL